MINFEEELKKFHPSLEIKDSEKTIYNQDLTDMADIFVELMQDSANNAPQQNMQQPVYGVQPGYASQDTGYIPVQAGQPGFIPQDTGYLPTDELYIPLDENGNV
ncbi:MAG: hypothetical protein MJ105_01525 [Lachnospiraceae bacterium]|nr:hypothetical protein [Lachnospiraceae bacterium]